MMINIVSSEFYKIFRSKILYAISIVLLIMNSIACIGSIVVKTSNSFSPEIKSQMQGTGVSSYQSSFGGDIIFYLIIIFIVCLITSEYSNGSIRQISSHGISRWKLVLGQYIAISFIITIILVSFGTINLVADSILFKFGEINIIEFIRMNLGIICMIFGVSGIGLFFSYLFKNGGIAIAVSILLVLCNGMMTNLISLLTKNNIFTHYTLGNMRNTIIDFTSNPLDILICSFVFLSIGIITVLSSCVLFSKRDVE